MSVPGWEDWAGPKGGGDGEGAQPKSMMTSMRVNESGIMLLPLLLLLVLLLL